MLSKDQPELTLAEIERIVNRASWPVAFREATNKCNMTPCEYLRMMFGNGVKPKAVQEPAAPKISRDPKLLAVEELTQDELSSELDSYSETEFYNMLSEPKQREFVDTVKRQWRTRDMTEAETILYLLRKFERRANKA
jgi:hypothetical protein